MPTIDRPSLTTGVDRDSALTRLQSFLKDELGALDTYRIALKYLDDPILFRSLSQIEADHQRHSGVLQERIQALGGTPQDTASAWGTWANFIATAGSWFGDKAAVKSLKDGEERGLRNYQEHLNEVDAESRLIIQNELVPAQQSHIRFIDSLLDRAV